MDDFKTVQKVGRTMAKQSNYHTQYPLFVIQVDYKRQPGIHEDATGTELGEDNEELEYVTDQKFDLTAGVFFTVEACREHIAMNSYHYDNPRPFCISAWRNPDMQAVMRQIINTATDEVPSHYK